MTPIREEEMEASNAVPLVLGIALLPSVLFCCVLS